MDNFAPIPLTSNLFILANASRVKAPKNINSKTLLKAFIIRIWVPPSLTMAVLSTPSWKERIVITNDVPMVITAIQEGNLKINDAQRLIEHIETSLRKSTYLQE